MVYIMTTICFVCSILSSVFLIVKGTHWGWPVALFFIAIMTLINGGSETIDRPKIDKGSGDV